MAPLSEEKLVNRIRYEALLGLLDCAEEVVETVEQSTANAVCAQSNIDILEFLIRCEIGGVVFDKNPPTFDLADECECPCECDESEKQTDDYGAEWPWIFFCKG